MTSLKLALALVLALPAVAGAQSNISLWGTVVWNTGAPAAGLMLDVKRRGAVVESKIYTNQAGRYGLYGLAAPTSDYTLDVLKAGKVIRSVALPALKTGQRVPDIVVP
jgi:hypothetical protein